MIKSISDFITTIDPRFRSLNLKPKEGLLHILLRVQQEKAGFS
ncbi:hypothetical protein ACDQ55_18820 [Chitinophaga sp. 30R24]